MRKNKKSGFTLVEIMISIGVLGLVLAVLFSFFLYSSRVVTQNSNRSDIQSEIRLLSSFITKELRNSVSITFTPISGQESTYSYLYLDNTDHLLKQRKANEATISVVSGVTFLGSADVSFSIIESTIKTGSYLAAFTLNGKYKDVRYSTNSDIALNNIASATVGSSKSFIYYKK